jgi:hypothetical protein
MEDEPPTTPYRRLAQALKGADAGSESYGDQQEARLEIKC